jgi:hypothetical protein
MSTSLRVLFLVVTAILVVFCLFKLEQIQRWDSSMGFWDSGHFSARMMPDPIPVPDDQLQPLGRTQRISLQPSPSEGANLLEVLRWYGLDSRHLKPIVKANGLGSMTEIPSNAIDVVLEEEK